MASVSRIHGKLARKIDPMVESRSTFSTFKVLKNFSPIVLYPSISVQRISGRCWRPAGVRMTLNKDHLLENLVENDPNFVVAFPLTAASISSGKHGFTIHMENGQDFKCRHNRMDSGILPTHGPEACMLLKLEDEEGNLFPLRVADQPRDFLLDSVRGISSLRPTVYQVVANMVDIFGFEIKLVRIMDMIQGNFCARIYLGEVGSNSTQVFSLDARASDAINLAVKSRVPIHVHRILAAREGLRLVRVTDGGSSSNDGYSCGLSRDDMPSADTCTAAEEFNLVRMLTDATEQERYFDAAILRDRLVWYRTLMSKETHGQDRV